VLRQLGIACGGGRNTRQLSLRELCGSQW